MKKRKYLLLVFAAILLIVISIGLYHCRKPLPSGISFRGKPHPIINNDVQFLHDLTWHDGNAVRMRQEIFDSVFALIDRADRYILIDMFLCNSHAGRSDRHYRQLSEELVDHLVKKRKTTPAINIDFITDPINTVYGGARSSVVERLRGAGVNVIVTDLAKLRDSNTLYSPFWRLLIAWLRNSVRGGIFPHPFSAAEPKVTLRSYLALLNFKANHRKVVLTEENGRLAAIVSSANPHDASAEHSNIAVMLRGPACRDIHECESAVARFSGGALTELAEDVDRSVQDSVSATATILTEGKIRIELLDRLAHARPGSRITVAVFYLSDRLVITALRNASHRGVPVDVILDRNTNAFGYTKRGIPNIPVADELRRGGCNVRFYRTGEEQFHTKMTLIKYEADSIWFMTGSANYTRRNIGDFNLEMNCAVSCPSKVAFAESAAAYCKRIVSDTVYTRPAEASTDVPRSSAVKYLRYRFFEAGGFSAF